ncbi:MAG: tyrosine-type recombinase/integrase [Pseudomonadaceae bacterium]|nr:tyrosine-type recombinase/integrase [Pseudomonadaceae bacterium]
MAHTQEITGPFLANIPRRYWPKKTQKSKQTFVNDTKSKLKLRLTLVDGGKNISVSCFVKFNGKPYTLGSYPDDFEDVPLSEIRERANRDYETLKEGNDPTPNPLDEVEEMDLNERVTLAQAFARFVARKEKTAKPKTVFDYKETWKRFMSMRDEMLTVDQADENFVNTKFLSVESKAYANRLRYILRKAINYERGVAKIAPLSDELIDNQHKIPPRDCRFDVDEEDDSISGDLGFVLKMAYEWAQSGLQIQTNSGPRDRGCNSHTDAQRRVAGDLIWFLALAGSRVGETRTLRWDNVDFEKMTVTFPETKNKLPLTIPITAPLNRVLQRCFKHRERFTDARQNWVFPGTKSEQLSTTGELCVGPSVGSKFWKKCTEKLGRNVRNHDFRHAFEEIASYELEIKSKYVDSLMNHQEKIPEKMGKRYRRNERRAVKMSTLRIHAETIADHIEALGVPEIEAEFEPN